MGVLAVSEPKEVPALSKNTTEHTLSLGQARRLILGAQGLGIGPGRGLAETVEQTGFVRTLGGVDVYLAILARCPRATRSEIDALVACGDLRVVPAVRGCIYLAARPHVAPALGLAKGLSRRRFEREHERAGILAGELETLGEAVLAALAEGPQSTSRLRRRLGDQVRSLGAEGKKVGVSSTLPPALRVLELDLSIERRTESGRLDSERYVWQLAGTAGHDGSSDGSGDGGGSVWMADLFFRWAGLAGEKSFAAWSGLGVREARRAMGECDLVEVEVEGEDGVFWASGDRRPWLADPSQLEAAGRVVAFLPFGDNLVAHQQGPRFWVDSEYHHIPVPVWGRGKGSTLGDARHSSLRPVMAGGRMVGFWELDPDTGEVVHVCFDRLSGATRVCLSERAEGLAVFLRDELGHGRSFSLDTEDALRKRVAHLRAL